MFASSNYSVSESGRLSIGGIDIIKLAQKYGTPLYVMDGDFFRNMCKMYRDVMRSCFDGNADVAYAGKAFCVSYIYRILEQESLLADVVSGGEIFTALNAGFPADKMVFHGSNKTEDEIRFAVTNDVGRFVVDNKYELSAIDRIAREEGKIANVIFRVKPGVEAHTHKFIKTGQIDSKFGSALENGEAFNIVKDALNYDNINVMGVHCHIGSQIFDTKPYAFAAEIMLDFIAEIENKLGFELKELNLGGGFGIKYTNEDAPPSIPEYIAKLAETVNRVCASKKIKRPKIIIEPGRSIAAPAGVTVYRVGSVKDIPGVRTYVSVDGGMTDNPRYILYGAKYTVENPANMLGEKNMLCTVAGRNCESGDLIAENVRVPNVVPGDYLAVMCTGAYNYSMASNYNRVPRPAVVMVENGRDQLVVRRETYQDLVRNDLMPPEE